MRSFFARRYDDAISQMKNSAENHPPTLNSLKLLGWISAAEGRYEEAIEYYRQGISIWGKPNPYMQGYMGHAFGESGNMDEARKILADLLELDKEGYLPPFIISLVYIGLGENENAIDWLEKAEEVLDWNLSYAKVYPLFDPLRSHPRFQELLRRMGFSETETTEFESR